MEKEFSIAPEEQEIARFQGEFQFRPSDSQSPKFLQAAQITEYNANGFLSGLEVFTPDEMVSHRAYFDDLLGRVISEGGTSYSISTAHLKYGPVYDLLRHPTIVGFVSDLLGDDVIGWGSHYFCKMPKDGQEVAWHQDATYWPLSPTNAVTVWLAIDDSDCENGCLRVIRGSHLHGRLQHAGATSESVLDRTVQDPTTLGQTVNVELQAGQISIHSDQLVHGSLKNESERRRCGLTLRYCTPDVRAGLDWHKKGVVVSGKPDSDHWFDATRPAEC